MLIKVFRAQPLNVNFSHKFVRNKIFIVLKEYNFEAVSPAPQNSKTKTRSKTLRSEIDFDNSA